MGLAMATKPKIDHAMKIHALHLMREATGGWIKGAKLYPISGAFLPIALPVEPIALSRRSYIAQVHAQKEGDIVQALQDAGLDAYCPRVPKSYRVNATKRMSRMIPMMPGYVFPIFDVHRDNWQVIHSQRHGCGIKGVIRLFMVDLRPVPVPDDAIQYMHEQEQHAIVYGKSMRHAPIPAKFAPGNWVQMTDMPWTGFLAKVESWLDYKSRIRVAIDIFGRTTLVEVSVTQVRAM